MVDFSFPDDPLVVSGDCSQSSWNCEPLCFPPAQGFDNMGEPKTFICQRSSLDTEMNEDSNIRGPYLIQSNSAVANPRQTEPQFQHEPLEDATIVTQTSLDILLGRGKPYQEHLGNRVLHKIVDIHATRYHSAPKMQRRKIAKEIVDALSFNGASFLQKHGANTWKVVTDEVAKDKVSHCFRSRRRGQLKKAEKK